MKTGHEKGISDVARGSLKRRTDRIIAQGRIILRENVSNVNIILFHKHNIELYKNI